MVKEFHERFDIIVDKKEAERRFASRAYNQVFDEFYGQIRSETDKIIVMRAVATALGKKFDYYKLRYEDYIEEDFFSCLRAIEVFYQANQDPQNKKTLDHLITGLLKASEVDLGIKWERHHFVRTGAKELDDKLVNEPLRWLRGKRYKSVLKPFEKGLGEFLEAEKKPERCYDAITGMYEAVESLAKIVTGRDKDLSANRELFIKSAKASQEYKGILKEYIDYANKFRHAPEQGQQKPMVSIAECESFVYLTGLFIRLTIQSEATKP
jgi:hypothetical protein